MRILVPLLFFILAFLVGDSCSLPVLEHRYELNGTVRCDSSKPFSFRIRFLELDSSFWTIDTSDEFSFMMDYSEHRETVKEAIYFFRAHEYTMKNPSHEGDFYVLAYKITYNCFPNSGTMYFESPPGETKYHGETMYFDLNKKKIRRTYWCSTRRCIAEDFELLYLSHERNL